MKRGPLARLLIVDDEGDLVAALCRVLEAQDAIGVGLEWCEAAAETTNVVSRMISLAGGITTEERSPFREHSR